MAEPTRSGPPKIQPRASSCSTPCDSEKILNDPARAKANHHHQDHQEQEQHLQQQPAPSIINDTEPTKHGQPQLILVLSKPKYVVAWCLMLLFHVADMVFLLAMNRVFHWLLHDPIAGGNLLDGLTSDFGHQTLDILNWSFVLVAGLHALVLVHPVYQGCGVPHHFPVLPAWMIKPKASARCLAPSKESTAQNAVPKPSGCLPVLSAARFVMDQVLSVDGKYFDEFFLVQECLEVTAQIYQGYQMSVLIATRWINNVFVCMLVLNCISTPLIHRLFPASSSASRRIAEISISAFLNFINSVVVPVVIFSKYWRAYDPNVHGFARSMAFDDIFYVKALRENQQLYISSLLDFLSTLWPHCSILDCLRVCASILHCAHQPSSSKLTVVEAINGQMVALGVPKSRYATAPSEPRTRQVGRTILRTLLCIAGLVVLVIHLDAQSVVQPDGCKLQATPWLHGHKSSCVVMNLNCHRRAIQGNSTELASVLARLNTKTLITLFFTHCPALEIPPTVRAFRALDGMEIYNSTLVDWPMESYFREEEAPAFEFLTFIRSNLGKIPDAFVLNDLPPRMDQLVFIETELHSLPPQVSRSWSNLFCLRLEKCGLQEIPAFLADLQPEFLYLAGNPFENSTAAVDLFANEELLSLALSGSSIAQLPETTSGRLTQLFRLVMEYTELEEVPSYIQKWYMRHVQEGNDVVHSLFGSPFCDKILPDVDPNEPERQYQQQVCAHDLGTALNFFPIDIVAAQRPL